ncbi:MAG: LysE family transporter [Bacteroidales bacterium]|nr:LysE family transporter [Bacteroidales bacterium]
MINYLIFGLTYAFACVVQPGPFQAFLFSQSIKNGWRKTIPLVFAPLLSDIPVIIFVLLVLTNVPHEVLQVLQIAGGLFLLYLAYTAYKAWQTFTPNVEKDNSPQFTVFKAVLVNLLNPNPYLAWSLVLGPMLIKSWNEAPVNGIVLLISFYGSMVIYSIGLTALFAVARNFGPGIIRISIGISVIAFAAFGVYQLWSGIVDFV